MHEAQVEVVVKVEDSRREMPLVSKLTATADDTIEGAGDRME
jgi:hypothetical protein